MRSALRVIVILALVSAVAPIARAGGGSRIDISKIKDKLVVLHDGHGHFVVVQPFDIDQKFYFGSRKVLYAQRDFGGFANKPGHEFSLDFWAPRTRRDLGFLALDHGHWKVMCGDRKTPFVVAKPKLTEEVLDHAAFKKALWKRTAAFLARDDRGVYFYVDRFRAAYGGKGYRLFIGRKGKLRLTRMVDVVSDSVGQIFATKSGDLRLVHNKNTAVWVHHHKRTELTIVPVVQNVALIYRDLGVYPGHLGIVCDDI